MLYKRDFYTLILEKVPTVGGDLLPHPPPLGRFAPSPRTSDKCAPFEVLPLQNSKCSGALALTFVVKKIACYQWNNDSVLANENASSF